MPITVVFESLESGATIDNIIEWFPGITREQIVKVLEFAAQSANVPAHR